EGGNNWSCWTDWQLSYCFQPPAEDISQAGPMNALRPALLNHAEGTVSCLTALPTSHYLLRGSYQRIPVPYWRSHRTEPPILPALPCFQHYNRNQIRQLRLLTVVSYGRQTSHSRHVLHAGV